MLAIILLLSACATTVTHNELESFDRHDDYNYFLSFLQEASLHSVSVNESGFAWPIDDQTGHSSTRFHLRDLWEKILLLESAMNQIHLFNISKRAGKEFVISIYLP